MLVLTVLGLIGITVGIIVLLFMLQGPGGPAAAPPAPRQASLAQAALPAPAPSLPTVITSSVGVGRPLPMPPQGHQALSRREPNGYFLYQPSYALTVLVQGVVAMERMRSGWSISQFQAVQQRSTMMS